VSKVAIIHTEPGTVLSDIGKSMEIAGFRSALNKNIYTIIKDNISWHKPYLPANTTPWQLEGTIRYLKGAGFEKIVAVHNNSVVMSPYKGLRLNKLDMIYHAYKIEEKFNFVPEDMKWVKYDPKTSLLALNKVYPKGVYIPEYFIGKNVVHLATMKTHYYTITTGAMKNAFGGLLRKDRHYAHTWIHEVLVDILSIQKEIHPGIFAIVDGTICGNGAGPRTTTPVEMNLILASTDCVAIDAVAAYIMGIDPMTIPYIRLAHEKRLGVGNIKEIDILGEKPLFKKSTFIVGNNLVGTFGKLMWFGPLKKLQWIFFHTPLVHIFAFGSLIYYDYLWWLLKGKRIQNKLRKTKWGSYFENYKVTTQG